MKKMVHLVQKLALVGIVLALTFASTPAALSSQSAQDDVMPMIRLPLVLRNITWASVDPSGQTITFWHNHTGSRQEALQTIIIDEFNATNPWDITVVQEYKGSYGDLYTQMLDVLNTEAAPDLVVAYQNQAATYQLSGALVDMNSLVESATWGLTVEDQADIFPSFWEQDIFPYFDNARLGFPPNRSMEMLYYNLDWLKELGYTAPPATPAEFRAMACGAVAHPFSSGSGGTSLGYMISIDASRFASWTFAFGGDIYDADTGLYTFNSPEAVSAMQFLQSLTTDGCMAIVTEAYEDQTAFAAGDLLFTVSSSAGIPFYRSAVEDDAQFDWNVGAIGYVTPDPVMNIYGASISMPKHTPESELAAWLFLKYFISTEVQTEWVYVSSYFPVRQSTVDALDAYFLANPQFATAFDLLLYSKAEPNTPFYDLTRNYVAEAMMAILTGEDVEDTLNWLNYVANGTLP